MKTSFRTGKINSARVLLFILITTFLGYSGAPAWGEDLPVKVPDYPASSAKIRNQITSEQLHRIAGQGSGGLVIDLGDPSLRGKVYTGPYPFAAGEADYDYARYRKAGPVAQGQATLPIAALLKEKYNANKWPDGRSPMTPTVAYRLDLWRVKDGIPQHLGLYGGVVSFRHEKDKFFKNLTIVEGPLVAQVSSDDPGKLLIAWNTDLKSSAKVFVYPIGGGKVRLHVGGKEFAVDDPMIFAGPRAGTEHMVSLSGLSPDTQYLYMAESATPDGEVVRSNLYSIRTAPDKGKGEVTLAFAGDSRAGVAGGEQDYMGMNFPALSRIAADAYRRGVDLFLFGGDLANGYTSDKEDLQMQLRAWKQAVSGYNRSRPIYVGMGNHESLTNSYKDTSPRGLHLDKWPYATDSAEAVFAAQFFNPSNAPAPSDPRRPPYAGNVYKFHYGPVLIIAFNNNYWWTTDDKVKEYGGSPEGYILEDQLTWIETALEEAESDPAVRYVVMFAHEPIFPCGGHVKDSMWWKGNNNVRAYTRQGGMLTPEKLGIIEVRNRLWKAVSRSAKVAVALTSHEHAYHRTLITNKTPVGVYPRDDTNNDGILDTYSPNADFLHPTWHITVGTAGAPYYSKEKDTPWTPVTFSSEEGYAIFHADNERISLKFISITGQVLDDIPDLMAVKGEKGE